MNFSPSRQRHVLTKSPFRRWLFTPETRERAQMMSRFFPIFLTLLGVGRGGTRSLVALVKSHRLNPKDGQKNWKKLSNHLCTLPSFRGEKSSSKPRLNSCQRLSSFQVVVGFTFRTLCLLVKKKQNCLLCFFYTFFCLYNEDCNKSFKWSGLQPWCELVLILLKLCFTLIYFVYF